jgi:predicted cobalt transporter CbtA
MRSFGALLGRGLLAGLIAGLLAGGFAYLAGEPSVDAAIILEEQAAPLHQAGEPAGQPDHHDEEEPLVSRDGQRAGLFLALGLYGVAIGGMFATAYAVLRRRLRARTDTSAILGLAAGAFVGMVLVPFVKYPANPPAVGSPDTIDQRTANYLALLVIGLAAVAMAFVAHRAIRPTAPDWLRLAGAGAAFLVVVVAAYAVLPDTDEVPATFPASLLWRFRLASLGTQLLLWTALGLTFAALLDRAARRTGRPAATSVATPAASATAG